MRAKKPEAIALAEVRARKENVENIQKTMDMLQAIAHSATASDRDKINAAREWAKMQGATRTDKSVQAQKAEKKTKGDGLKLSPEELERITELSGMPRG